MRLPKLRRASLENAMVSIVLLALIIAIAMTTMGCSPIFAALLAARQADGGTISVDQRISADTSSSDDSFELSCGSPNSSGDQAWTFVPPATGRYRVHVAAEYDSVVAVLRGRDEGDVVECNDDFGSTRESQVMVSLEEGLTYTIVVDGYSGQEGVYTLAVTLPQSSAGGALSLGRRVEGNTVSSGDDYHPTCGDARGPDDAWVFSPPADGVYHFHVDGEYDSVLAIFDEGGGELGCNDDFRTTADSRVSAPLQASREYFVVVDGYGGATGSYVLRAGSGPGDGVSSTPPEGPPPESAPPPEPPVEDVGAMESRCAQASMLGPGRTVGDLDAAVALARVSCGSSGPGGDVVYRLVVERRSVVTIEEESIFDAIVELRRGCSEGHEVIACNDDSVDTSHALLTATLDPGTYYVVVDAFGQNAGGAFSLEVTFAPE